MVFMAFRAIEGTRGENPLIYMIFRRYRYHSAIIMSRIKPDIAVARNSRQPRQRIQLKIGYYTDF